MFKKSVYNVEVDNLEDNKKLIFNTVSCSLGVIDKETQELYKSIENIEITDLKDDKVKENIDKMHKNGFIVDKGINEKDRLKIYNNISRFSRKDTLNIIIAPTMNCNMKCPYCYEDKTNCTMNKEIRDDLIKFIKNSIKHGKKEHLTVVWYGGEPLLAKEIIRDISKELIKFCDENNVSYAGNIITNGTLYDNKTALMLKEECRVKNVQITLDGFKDTHNARRILKSGDDSFSKIIKNIKENKDIIKIAIRINVDKSNVDESKKLIEYLSDNELWEESIGLYYCYTSIYFGWIYSN